MNSLRLLILQLLVTGVVSSECPGQTVAPRLPSSAAPAAPSNARNLFVNSSFVNGTQGWELIAFDKKGTMMIDTTELHNGKPTLRIDNVEGDHSFVRQVLTGKPNTRYRVTGFIKTKDVLPVKPGDKSGAILMVGLTGETTQPMANTTPWAKVTLDFSTKDKAEIRVGGSLGYYASKVTGTAWFSELEIIELGDAPAAAPSVAQHPADPKPSSPPPFNGGAEAGALVKTYRNSLVFVNGTNGAGSGFVASLAGSAFLFTNAHVAAGVRGAAFKTLDGAQVQGGAASVAVGHDIFSMQLASGGKPFEVMHGVDENASIDDEIVVLGNAEGAGVVNLIKGKIVGIGPNLVEVDAPFVPGNSGSPIVHLKSGKVIGVATYLIIKKYDAATKEAIKEPIIRRFGYRLDSVTAWQAVNWQAFYAQAGEMEKIETLTDEFDNLIRDLAAHKGINTGSIANAVIRSRMSAWNAERSRQLSPKDRAMVNQNFVTFLKTACQSDVTAVRPRLSYDYFQRALADQQRARNEIAEVFDKIIKDIQTDR